VVNDFLKESIRAKAREMVNDKFFLDGVLDGIVVDTRMKMGEFNSKAFCTILAHFETIMGYHKFTSDNSSYIRDTFSTSVDFTYAMPAEDHIAINQYLSPIDRLNSFEIYGLVKDALVVIKDYNNHSNAIRFEIKYKYAQKEVIELEAIELAMEFARERRAIRESMRLKIGDHVVHKDGHPLRSGASEYPYAVVFSLEPFILKSVTGDMAWSATVKEEDYREWVPF